MPRFWFFIGIAVLVSAVVLLGVTACVTSRPYRTEVNEGRTCSPIDYSGSSGTNSDPCQSQAPEVVPDEYELHYVEFDDQGWLHSSKTSEQINALDALMEKLKGKKNVSIVLYVHGWKHNASYYDRDVREFRRVLQGVRIVERATSPGEERDVVGIYVGWRGQSLNVPKLLEPLTNITFWDRKFATIRIAQGSVRELFSRLTGFQRYHNKGDDDRRPSNDGTAPRRNVRMILIGHSFGAWILYSAISGFLIEDLSANLDVSDDVPPGERFADMVVLINPAFDGARYEPLHRVANVLRSYDKYEPPILVSVTSKTDWALGRAFPLGRFFMTIFQKPTSSDKQSEAISNTLGHIDRYITHELTKSDETPPKCKPWQDVTNLAGKERFDQQLRKNIDAEEDNAKDFFKQHLVDKKLPPGWKRTFCGGAVLKHLADGYDLRLMSVDAADGLLNEGRNLVIVALVGTDLHIRAFDANGKRVVDKAENELISGETLTALKKRLNPLPDESRLSQEQKQEFIGAATSITGHTLADNSANSDPNSTVWNIRVDESIIDGHNDIHKPVFLSFIRQLYHDVTQNPWQWDNHALTGSRDMR